MKLIIVCGLLIATSFGCTENRNYNFVVLDSLKRKYAGKLIHINITDSLNLQRYAYVDKRRLDTAFKIFTTQKFEMAIEEGFPFRPTMISMRPDDDGMVLILGNKSKYGRASGFIHYSHIAELSSKRN